MRKNDHLNKSEPETLLQFKTIQTE